MFPLKDTPERKEKPLRPFRDTFKIKQEIVINASLKVTAYLKIYSVLFLLSNFFYARPAVVYFICWGAWVLRYFSTIQGPIKQASKELLIIAFYFFYEIF